MSDLRIQSRQKTDKAPGVPGQERTSAYSPPCALLLDGLGISSSDLEGNGTANVSRAFLRALISELAARMGFDEDWYAEMYPDVEGARLAGDIKSLHEHFKLSGYFEGRLPAELPFDPQWYRRYYKDIADAFPASDAQGMRMHFLKSGYFEGRAGTAEMLADAERFRTLAIR
jgi:hypothetical protein